MAKFDPTRVQVKWGADTITGFAAGSFVEIAFNSPNEYEAQANFGTVIHVQNPDRSGTITVRLKPDAGPILKKLQAARVADRATGGNVTKPLVVADLNGNDLFTLSKARIMNRAGKTYDSATGPSPNEFMFGGETLVESVNGLNSD